MLASPPAGQRKRPLVTYHQDRETMLWSIRFIDPDLGTVGSYGTVSSAKRAVATGAAMRKVDGLACTCEGRGHNGHGPDCQLQRGLL